MNAFINVCGLAVSVGDDRPADATGRIRAKPTINGLGTRLDGIRNRRPRDMSSEENLRNAPLRVPLPSHNATAQRRLDIYQQSDESFPNGPGAVPTRSV